MRRIAIGILALTGAVQPAIAQQWIESKGGKSCEEVCNTRGTSSGTFLGQASGPAKGVGKGTLFHVCRAHAGSTVEGERPGWNLHFSPWREACWVAFGGKETRISKFDCLCEPRVPIIE